MTLIKDIPSLPELTTEDKVIIHDVSTVKEGLTTVQDIIDLVPSSIPAGGSTGSVLTKNSETDYDTTWETPAVYVDGPVSSTDNAVARFDSTSGKFIQNSLVTIDDNGVIETPNLNDVEKNIIRSLSTGLLDGGEITINGGDNTKFDVAAGEGIIVDSWTDPLNPTISQVSWSAKTAVTATYLTAASTTFLFIDSNGDIVQSVDFPNNGDLRDKIQIGSIVHSDRTTITGTSDFVQTPITNISQSLTDFQIAIGVINESGNTFFGTTGQNKIEKTSGVSMYAGINFKNNKKDPNRKSVPIKAADDVFIYSWRDGVGGFNTSLTNTILVNRYDDGTGGVSQPNGVVTANKWVIDRILYSPDAEIAVVAFGQNSYSTSSSALTALAEGQDTFTLDPQFLGVPLRAFLIRKQGGTDLSSSSNAIFKDAGKFGASLVSGGSASSVVTLQAAYDISSDPEILTDIVRGALTLQIGTGTDTDKALEVKNGAGTINFSVDGTGAIVGSTLNTGQGANELYAMNQDVQTTDDVTFNTVDGRDVATDGTKLDGIEAGAEVNNISDVNATDLTDSGDTSLHYHSSDRARANHTGTQTMSTISDAGALATLDTVGTTEIDDDSVTLAKIASGTDGELITWDSNGDPSPVSVGTAGQILTSNGAGSAPSFQNNTSAGLVIGRYSVELSPPGSSTTSTGFSSTTQTITYTPVSSTSTLFVEFDVETAVIPSSGNGYALFRITDGTVNSTERTTVGVDNSATISSLNRTVVSADFASTGTSSRTFTLQYRVGATGRTALLANNGAGFKNVARVTEIEV